MTDTLTKLRSHMAAMRSKQPMVYLDWDQLEALIKCAEMLEPFVNAAHLGEVSGKPPFMFVGADDFERAAKALKSLNEVSA